MEEVEEVIENLMHNEIDVLDLSFEFAQQAPFTALLYHHRLPDFSEAEFGTLITVLLDSLQQNESVRVVHLDWSFLRLLQPTEQEGLLRRIGSLPQLRHVNISGTTANPTHQHVSIYCLLRLLEASRQLEILEMDAMGSLKMQDWIYVEHLSQALQHSASTLRILKLENLVLPQMPPSNVYALDRLIEKLGAQCTALQALHVAVSLPRQYRRISQPIVRVETLEMLQSLHILRLHNWGLQASHLFALLLNLPHLAQLDVTNNPLDNRVVNRMREILSSRQQMQLQEIWGIGHNDTVLERYLLLNCCGRAMAGEGPGQTLEFWAAINSNHTTDHHSGGDGDSSTVLLDALYTAVREQPCHVPTTRADVR